MNGLRWIQVHSAEVEMEILLHDLHTLLTAREGWRDDRMSIGYFWAERWWRTREKSSRGSFWMCDSNNGDDSNMVDRGRRTTLETQN